MAVKIGNALGAEVTVFSRSESKRQDAKRLGAVGYVATEKEENLNGLAGKFDFLVDTVSGNNDYNAYLELLARDGTMILVGAPSEPLSFAGFNIVLKRRRLAGSLIGGIQETQEMLDFCAEHNITSDVEVIPCQKINEAYDRTVKGDVRFRFVIDMESLEK